jgi:hypothetical protein
MMRLCMVAFVILVPQAPSKWPSPIKMPKGSEQYESAKYTQSIYVLNNRDTIEKVPIRNLEAKWRFSGGLADVDGWKSVKYRYVPGGVESTWIGTIYVRNSFGDYQPNRGILRNYPDGTRFDDILTYKGKVFEHRCRDKVDGKWRSRVLYSRVENRPPGYGGLKQSCASCHEKSGSGEYGVGLVPGGDTVLSDPLDWRVWR